MSGVNHYLKHERVYMVVMLCCFLFVETSINATTMIMEWSKDGEMTPAWVAFVLEYTSGVALAVLFPLVWLFEKRFPLTWQDFKRHIGFHVIGSVVFTILHIVLMVAMRTPIFKLNGMSYGLGEFSWELLFEYRKDAWTYAFILVVINIYRFIVSRLRGEAKLVDSGENNDGPEINDRLLIRKLGKEFIIRVEDVEWLESSGNYVNLYIKNHIYPLRSTLSSLVAKLESRGFSRVHRSYAVNLECVASINPLESGDASIILTNGREIPFSRRYRDEFRRRL